MDFQNYTEATFSKRIIGFLVNFAAISLFWYPMHWLEMDDPLSYNFALITVVSICTYRYWSPGRFIGGTKVLKNDRSELSMKERFLRNTPIFLVFVSTAINRIAMKDYEPGIVRIHEMIVTFISFGIMLFFLANYFTPFFNQKRQNLIDMKLHTGVYMPPPYKPLKIKV